MLPPLVQIRYNCENIFYRKLNVVQQNCYVLQVSLRNRSFKDGLSLPAALLIESSEETPRAQYA